MPYWKLYYHIVWATFERLPLIDGDRERIIHSTLYAKAKELGLVVHAMGNVQNHLHVVASIPPTRSVAECVKHLKGASSRAVNAHETSHAFQWQEGYGALSFAERSFRTVVAYVKDQKQHHEQGTLIDLYEFTEPRRSLCPSRLQTTSRKP